MNVEIQNHPFHINLILFPFFLQVLFLKTLVTGASGFVGKYYCALPGTMPLETKARGFVDLRDVETLQENLTRISPDCVIHLAAQASPRQSLEIQDETRRVNVEGTSNLLTGLLKNGFSGRFLFISSSHVYAQDIEGNIKETDALKPATPYAVSKREGEVMALDFADKGGFEVVIARSFNHTGPRQNEIYVVPSLVAQLKQCMVKSAKTGVPGPTPHEIIVGQTDIEFDLTDVRDVVRAYQLLLEKGVHGEVYNVCSGRGVTIGAILHQLINMAGIQAKVIQDPARMRPGEPMRRVGDNLKLKKTTLWEPEISLEQTLKDMLFS